MNRSHRISSFSEVQVGLLNGTVYSAGIVVGPANTPVALADIAVPCGGGIVELADNFVALEMNRLLLERAVVRLAHIPVGSAEGIVTSAEDINMLEKGVVASAEGISMSEKAFEVQEIELIAPAKRFGLLEMKMRTMNKHLLV